MNRAQFDKEFKEIKTAELKKHTALEFYQQQHQKQKKKLDQTLHDLDSFTAEITNRITKKSTTQRATGNKGAKKKAVKKARKTPIKKTTPKKTTPKKSTPKKATPKKTTPKKKTKKRTANPLFSPAKTRSKAKVKVEQAIDI